MFYKIEQQQKMWVFSSMFRLPPGFVQLRNLTVLGLNDMSLTNLPSDFGR